jgi:hypothetical protein
MPRFVLAILISLEISASGPRLLQCVLPTLLEGKGENNEAKTWILAGSINERENHMEIISL